MGFITFSGPPTCDGSCSTPCRCNGMGAGTGANGNIGDTGAPGGIGGAPQGAPLSQGGPSCADPGQGIGNIGTSTTHVKMKSNPNSYSQNSSESECLSVPLRNGESLRLAWVRLNGTDVGFSDNFWPAGLGALWSFQPVVHPLNHPESDEAWAEKLPEGVLSYGNSGAPHAEIPRYGIIGATYFTTFDERLGSYFEYFQGTQFQGDSGRLNRQYDGHGNELKYDNRYVNLWGTIPTLMPFAIGGNALGRVIPYFEYSGTTNDTVANYHIAKIYLLDLDAPSQSRTIYFNYVGGPTAPVLSSVVYPNGCTHQYNSQGGGEWSAQYNNLFSEVDAEGYVTYYEYMPPTGTETPPLKRTVEPEGRATYFEYPSSGNTQKRLVGRGTAYFKYNLSSAIDQSPMATVQVDPLNNKTQWGYDPTLDHVSRRLNANGDLTYFEYVGGSGPNHDAVARKLRTTSGAQTYYGYNGTTYDLAKVVGPRHTATFNATTYYEYNATRDRTTVIDALGNTTRVGYDSLGQKVRVQDARGNVTYLAYGASTGHLDAVVVADGGVSYFGYNSFRNQVRQVSSRWVEQTAAAFTTYFEVDQLGRRTKAIDPLGNVTYFAWTSRSDPLDTVDALGTTTAHTYNGLRLRTQTTVTSASGTVLSRVKDGFDTYKNRIRTEDGLGNATYFFYDELDRLVARKDALQNASYFFYDSIGRVTARTDARNNPSYHFYDQLARDTATLDALGHLTYYFYDLADNRTHVVDARRNASYFFYDALDRRQAARDALGNPSYFFYDPAGNQAVSMDARFAPTYFGYDSVNRNTRVQDALRNTTYFAHDNAGNRVRIIDARANVTSFGFDTLDRPLAERDALGGATYFFYDAVGNPIRQIDARQNASYFFFDGLRRRTATRDALANAAYFFYDLAGNQAVSMNARFAATYFGYDALNRRTRVQDVLGNATYFVYDAVGNQSLVVDPRSNTMESFYDALNRPTVIRDALANSSYHFYDAVGNQSILMNARFAATYFGYDGVNRQTQVQDSLGNSTYYAYDVVGNRTVLVNARSASTYFGYDLLNRQAQVQDSLGNVTYFAYDAVGNQIRIVDPRSSVAESFYDALNRPSVMRNALGHPTYYFYDPVGNQSVLMNARFASAYFGYDAVNRWTQAQDALGNTTYYSYDAAGNATRVVDARSNAMASFYDLLDRPTVQLDALSNPAYYFYDGAGNRTGVLNPRFAATYFGYDALNRRSRVLNALGHSTYYFYDAVGNRTGEMDPLGHATYFGYDALDRPVRVLESVGASTYYEYDSVGNWTKEVDPNNHSTETLFDLLNRPSATRYADAGSAYYFYDQASNRTVLLDPLRNATYYAYDALDQTTRIQDALGKSLYFEYDAVGNLSSFVDSEGASSAHTYDSLNRRTKTNYTAGGSESLAGLRPEAYFVYDEVGSLTEMGGLWGLHQMGYDANSRLVRHRYPDRQSSVVYFEYDQASNLTTRVYPGAAGRAGAAYDLLNRQTRVQSPSGATAYFSYNAASKPTQRILGNGVKLTVLYDDAERIQSWRWSDANGAALSYFDYTRNAKGQITKSVREAVHTVYYRYDLCDRLDAEIWATTGASPTEVYAYRYQYDRAGNRIVKKELASLAYYRYNAANQLLMSSSTADFASANSYWHYDENGSFTRGTGFAGSHKFGYNAAGKLAKIEWQGGQSQYFFYDANQQLYGTVKWAASEPAYFFWDGPNLLQETWKGSLKDEHTVADPPLPGIGQLVETRRPGNAQEKIYPVTDPRGSVLKWMASDGVTVVDYGEYEAFGRIIPNSRPSNTWVEQRLQYQGQTWLAIQSTRNWLDSTFQFYVTPTRVYDPLIGRFLSPDPVGRTDPLSQIQTYQYCHQDPVNNVDPTGLESALAMGQQMPDWARESQELQIAMSSAYAQMVYRGRQSLAMGGMFLNPISNPGGAIPGDFIPSGTTCRFGIGGGCGTSQWWTAGAQAASGLGLGGRMGSNPNLFVHPGGGSGGILPGGSSSGRPGTIAGSGGIGGIGWIIGGGLGGLPGLTRPVCPDPRSTYYQQTQQCGFIAVATRPVTGTPAGNHMSIEFWQEPSCGFTWNIEGTQFAMVPLTPATKVDQVELLNSENTYHTWIIGNNGNPPPNTALRYVWKPVNIAFIHRTSRAFIQHIIYADANVGAGLSKARWEQTIIPKATGYAFAEQAPTGGPLKRWPNSRYEPFGTNSNTFIRWLAFLLGRDADVLPGWHPGNDWPVAPAAWNAPTPVPTATPTIPMPN